jgi:hypothetical protein
MNKDLIKFTPTSAMISSYQMAVKEVEEAFNRLAVVHKGICTGGI